MTARQATPDTRPDPAGGGRPRRPPARPRFRGVLLSGGARPAATTPEADAPAVLKDPVCGMTVTAASKHVHTHEGRPVYFCSAGCRTKFIADPDRYTKPADAAPPDAEAPIAGAVYTCPMHPEIRQDHPGACPKCGMALEPEMPSLDDGESPELVDFRRRFWWTLPLTVVVTVLAMVGPSARHRSTWRRRAGSSSC